MTVLPRLLSASVFVLGAAAFAPAQSGVITWKPTKKATAQSMAKRADVAMGRIRHVMVEGSLKLAIPSRKGVGQTNTKTLFQDRKLLRAEFGVMSFDLRSELSKATMKSDGKRSLLVITGKPTKKAKAGDMKLFVGATPDTWGLQHPRYFVAGLLGESPFSALAAQVSRPGSGFVSVVKERSFLKGTIRTTQFQWVVQRTVANTKKKGPLRLEFIFDANLSLPVSMSSDYAPKGKDRMITTNKYVWKSKRTDFDPKIFKLSKS